MKKFKWFLVVLLLYSSFECWSQVETTITDSTIYSVLDEFIYHLKKKGEFEHAIIRIQLRAHSVESGIDPESFKEGGVRLDSIKLKQWNTLRVEYHYFLVNERMNSTLDLKIPSYYTSYRGIPVLISSGIESLVEPDSKAVAKVKKMLVKHFMPPGLLPLSSVWFVSVKNNKYEIMEIF